MRKVVWTESGDADYLDAISFIALDNPRGADRVSARILGAANALGRAATGRPGRVSGTYEKSLTDVKYIIAYSLDDPVGVVNILRVIHTSREWPPESWPE